MDYPKVIGICCTYGRFKCVERLINMFLSQDYQGEKRLVIYNTDVDSPYIYSDELNELGVTFINNNIDNETFEQYTNVGSIRRDALDYVIDNEIAQGRSGDFYIFHADDDDIYLKHYISQGIDRIKQTGLPSFKPEKSFFYSGNNLRLVANTLEASIIADVKKVKEYGYLLETGKEGLGWYTKMRDNKELDEHDVNYIPSYCFNWNDGQEMNAHHKQSGDIDNPSNFENHKKNSQDKVNGRNISVYPKEYMDDVVYKDYYHYLYTHEEEFPKELVDRYLY